MTEADIETFLEALQAEFQYDFRHYGRSSMRRRLTQALFKFSCESLLELEARLRSDPTLLGRLLDFLTVPTTEMFRDPEYFAAVRKEVVPMLKTYATVKVWIAGCSTGEELYSLAIVFKEEGLLERTVFYATDLNPNSLAKAERGIYDTHVIQKATPNYRLSGGSSTLTDYCTAAYGSVQIDPQLRKHVVFSDHSLVSDTVFAEVQFVSCRNVLIYFDRVLQDRAIGLFRASLARGGFLGLGSKETVQFSCHAHAFTLLDRPARLYRLGTES